MVALIKNLAQVFHEVQQTPEYLRSVHRSSSDTAKFSCPTKCGTVGLLSREELYDHVDKCERILRKCRCCPINLIVEHEKFPCLSKRDFLKEQAVIEKLRPELVMKDLEQVKMHFIV